MSRKPKPPPVRTVPTTILVTIWPEGHECSGALDLCLSVKWRRGNEWAIHRGFYAANTAPVCLSAAGTWDYDQGRPDQRFTRDEALVLAEIHAPHVQDMRGRTAADVLADHGPGPCDR